MLLNSFLRDFYSQFWKNFAEQTWRTDSRILWITFQENVRQNQWKNVGNYIQSSMRILEDWRKYWMSMEIIALVNFRKLFSIRDRSKTLFQDDFFFYWIKKEYPERNLDWFNKRKFGSSEEICGKAPAVVLGKFCLAIFDSNFDGIFAKFLLQILS